MCDSDEECFHDCSESGDTMSAVSVMSEMSADSRDQSAKNDLHTNFENQANTVSIGELEQNGDKFNSTHSDGEISVWGSRTRLPCTMFSRSDYSVWSILKHCIGKELSKITMPVVFNEPLSFLQRVVEYMEYHTLLTKASNSMDPIERQELVTAFAVSATASNWDRLGKPFNPLLCETYELDREDLGFKIVCEQVSHHPPVSAFHAESPLYTFNGSINPKLKFWGKSVEVTPRGLVTLYLKRHKEAYSWQNMNCCVHNVIVGKIWVEHYGTMEVTNHRTNYKSILNFRQCGWFGKDLHKVDGFLFDNQKRKIRAFYGKWVDALYSFNVDNYEEYNRLATAAAAGKQPSIPTSGTEANLANISSGERKSSIKSCIDKSNSEPSFQAMASGQAEGNVEVPDDVPVRTSGCDLNLPSQKLLWVASPKPSNSQCYYSFTTFAMILNALDDSTVARIPPTDSRLRPDMRKMEDGLIDAAAEEKNRIEEKQRAARRDKKKRKNEEQAPEWFKLGRNPHTDKEDWLFTGEYWRRDWSRCPDIY